MCSKTLNWFGLDGFGLRVRISANFQRKIEWIKLMQVKFNAHIMFDKGGEGTGTPGGVQFVTGFFAKH